MTRIVPLAMLLGLPLAACGTAPVAWQGPPDAMKLPGGMRASDGLLGIQRWQDLDPLKPSMRRQATENLPPVEATKKDLPERIAREEGEKRLVRIPRENRGDRRGRRGGGLGEDPPDVVGFGSLGYCGTAWNDGFWGGDAWSFAPYGWSGNLCLIPYALVGAYDVPAYVPFYDRAATLAPYQDLPLAYGTTPPVPHPSASGHPWPAPWHPLAAYRAASRSGRVCLQATHPGPSATGPSGMAPARPRCLTASGLDARP
ncbi:MAG: hypothetical protein FJY99_01270 [Candidatus Sericytochromatia bacterium]|nr:hypothetical protein [Candidatus Tanganyikabacteria bacterium]